MHQLLVLQSIATSQTLHVEHHPNSPHTPTNQTQRTVTLKVLGTARNALLVVSSVYLFGEVVSPLQFLGYSFSLGAFACYSYHKARASS